MCAHTCVCAYRVCVCVCLAFIMVVVSVAPMHREKSSTENVRNVQTRRDPMSGDFVYVYVCSDIVRRIHYIRLLDACVCVALSGMYARAIFTSSDVVATPPTTTTFNDERNVENRLLERIK